MICFDVSLNDEHVCTAGVGDEGVLTAILGWSDAVENRAKTKKRRGVDLQVGGISEDKHVSWVEAFDKLEVGDTVTIRIIESAKPERPRRRKIRTTTPDEPEYGPPQEGPQCSFCSRFAGEVRKLLPGPTVYICNDCVEI